MSTKNQPVGAPNSGGIEFAAACAKHRPVLPAAWVDLKKSASWVGKDRACDFCEMDAGEMPRRRAQLHAVNLYPEGKPHAD